MLDTLSIDEIPARFDAECVLVEDPQTDENLPHEAVPYRWHSKDREELYREAAAMPEPRRFAMCYRARSKNQRGESRQLSRHAAAHRVLRPQLRFRLKSVDLRQGESKARGCPPAIDS